MFHQFNYQFSIIEVIIFISVLGAAGYVFFLDAFTTFCTDKDSVDEYKKLALVFSIVQTVGLAVWMLWGE